jgi:hypothetical protein
VVSVLMVWRWNRRERLGLATNPSGAATSSHDSITQ